MKRINIKSNKGITLVDVVLAMTILSLFVGVVGNLYYVILKHNNMIRYDTIAVYYAIKIAEDIDKMSYADVNSSLNTSVSEKYKLPENLTGTINVENYNANDSKKQDIIKKVKITIKYTFLDEEKKYEIIKLKIKEK